MGQQSQILDVILKLYKINKQYELEANREDTLHDIAMFLKSIVQANTQLSQGSFVFKQTETGNPLEHTLKLKELMRLPASKLELQVELGTETEKSSKGNNCCATF